MGQQRISILDLSTVATSIVAAYRGVDFNGAQITAANAKIYGISKHAAAIGEALELGVLGTMTCEAGAAITKGAALAMDTTGRVVAATTLTAAVGSLAVGTGAVAMTSTAANGAVITGAPTLTGGDLPQFIVGHALEAAGAAGAFIEVLLSR